MELRTELLLDNLKTIRALESKEPGVSKTLYEEFGLTCLGRYPEESLMRQYKERDKAGVYLPAFNAIPDHNGSSDRKKVHEKTMEGFTGEGAPFLRFIEFSDKHRGEIAADKLRTKYGPASFGSVQVHGFKDGLLTTGQGLGNKYGARFEIEQLRQGELGLFRVFAPEACIVLMSCSTGVEGGFAQELSGAGFTVKAPDKDAACDKLDAKILPGGKVDLTPEYRTDWFVPATCKTYTNGVLTGSSTPEKLY